MAWTILILAGVLEAIWAVGLKATDGFTKPLISVVVGAAIVASMLLLAQAARSIPIGTAYAVWVGIGAFGAVLLESAFYGVPLTVPRLLVLALLLFAIGGLKATA
jgi:quaternary ammonium compound-resistance protein SugE